MKSNFKFRDYQQKIVEDGFLKLIRLNVILLNLEVRTGKTLISLGIAQKIKAKKVLFITKLKVIESKTISKDYEMLGADFILDQINYESVHKVETDDVDLFIIDESHSLGAFPKASKRTKEIKKIIGDKKVILLTGTSTPESWSQIYHQFWISNYSPFSETNFYKWAHNYVEVKKIRIAHGREANDYSNANMELIEEMIKDYRITFTQKAAGFSTSITEKVLTVDMKPITYKLIARLKKDLVIEGSSGVILADTPVKLMQKTHQLCSGTVKLEEGNSVIIDDSKAQFIKKHFEGKKIGIFYKFKAEFEMIKNVFGDAVTNNLHIFNSTDKNIALQIVSGREGISLKNADFLVFFNIDFSATSYWQARDRMTTKDRSENTIYWVFSKDGIEEKIYTTVQKKKSYTLAHFQKSLNEKPKPLQLF